MTGLNGPSSMLGEPYAWLQVAGVDMKKRVRLIVVDAIPEGQEMLLGCRDLKFFFLVYPQFPKPYMEVRDGLHLPRVSHSQLGRGHGGGDELHEMEDAFFTS